MAGFIEALKDTFGINNADEGTNKAPVIEVPSNIKKSYKKPPVIRGMGDGLVVAQAQKIYNPNQPVTAQPKAPTATMADQGVSQVNKDAGWGRVN